MMCLIFLTHLLWTTLVPGSVLGSEKSDVAAIGTALNKRSTLAKDIAANKFKSNEDLATPSRRQGEVNRIVAIAAKQGLDVDSVKPFAEAMLDMDLDIQKGYTDEWKKNKTGPKGKPRDYKTVRKDVMNVDETIMKLIHKRLENDVFRESDRAEIYRLLNAPYTTDSNRKVLVDTLFQIKLKNC